MLNWREMNQDKLEKEMMFYFWLWMERYPFSYWFANHKLGIAEGAD